MNTGRCKKCGAEIIWIPIETGGWYPPMERMDAALDDRTHALINSRKTFLLDGGISEVRLSALVVRHACPDEASPPDSTLRSSSEPDPEAPPLEGVDAERILARVQILLSELLGGDVTQGLKLATPEAPQQAAPVTPAPEPPAERRPKRFERRPKRFPVAREEAIKARYQGVISVTCPRCGAPAGERCRNMSLGRANGNPTLAPHEDRSVAEFRVAATPDTRSKSVPFSHRELSGSERAAMRSFIQGPGGKMFTKS